MIILLYKVYIYIYIKYTLVLLINGRIYIYIYIDYHYMPSILIYYIGIPMCLLYIYMFTLIIYLRYIVI